MMSDPPTTAVVVDVFRVDKTDRNGHTVYFEVREALPHRYSRSDKGQGWPGEEYETGSLVQIAWARCLHGLNCIYDFHPVLVGTA